MPRVPVESSVLTSISYLPRLRQLEVEFRSGELYQYFDVPRQTYNELLRAASRGEYFNANIRNCFCCKQLNRPLRVGRAGGKS